MTPRLIKIFSALALAFLLAPLSIEAIQIDNPLKYNTFQKLIEAIIKFLAFQLGPAVAAIMIIVAGYYFVTAAGDPEKIQTAKRIILWTLIGLLVLFCATGLIELLKTVIGLRNP